MDGEIMMEGQVGLDGWIGGKERAKAGESPRRAALLAPTGLPGSRAAAGPRTRARAEGSSAASLAARGGGAGRAGVADMWRGGRGVGRNQRHQARPDAGAVT